MATLIYKSGMQSDYISDGYGGQLLQHDENSATVTAMLTGDLVRYTGHDFVYDGTTIVSGIADTYTYLVPWPPEYHLFFRVTDFTWDMSNGSPNLDTILSGNDTIQGSRSTRVLDGGAGNDFITAKNGGYIEGSTGNDLLQGSSEKDHFLFYVGDGSDKILNFDALHRGHDTIEIVRTPEAENVDVQELHGRVVIHYGVDDRIVLHGVHLDDVSANDLKFF